MTIRTKMKLSDDEVEHDRYPRINKITNTKEPSYFVVKIGNMEVSVGLTPAVPPNRENPMLVSHVIFQMPRTPENKLSMQSSLLKNMANHRMG